MKPDIDEMNEQMKEMFKSMNVEQFVSLLNIIVSLLIRNIPPDDPKILEFLALLEDVVTESKLVALKLDAVRERLSAYVNGGTKKE